MSAIRRPISQAYDILQWAYVLLLVIAGIDKFGNLLARWETFLAEPIAGLIPLTKHQVMMGVGIIEIVVAFLTALKPVIGGYLAAGWLFIVIIDLFVRGGAWDAALFDAALMLGAIAFARLATVRSTDTDGAASSPLGR